MATNWHIYYHQFLNINYHHIWSFPKGNLQFPTFPPVLKSSSLHIVLDTKPQPESLPTTRKHTCLWTGSPTLPINHQYYGSLTKPVWLSPQRGETSLADQFSSSLATCHSPLCFSHLILQYCSTALPPLLYPLFFLPVIILLREVVLGYLLWNILHCAYCSNCLLSKEVGRNETATHRFSYVTSISLHFSPAKHSFRATSVNRYAQCCEICKNLIYNSTLIMKLMQVFKC